MRITIDTNVDSVDSIRHVIQLLSRIIEKNNPGFRDAKSRDIFSNEPAMDVSSNKSSGNAFSNMFGDNAPNQVQNSPPEQNVQEISGQTENDKREEELRDQIQIIEY